MDRRELLKMIAILTGGAVIGGEALLTGCKSPATEVSMTFSEEDKLLLDEIAETILPKTKSPGAKDAKVGEFITVIVNDCYEEDDQKVFHEGIVKLNEACNKMHSTSFMKASAQQRHDLLVSLDKEAKDVQDKRKVFNEDQDKKEREARNRGEKDYKKDKMAAHYFTLIKQLTMWGYFTSKEAINGAFRFNAVPGRFDACIDYKGEPAYVNLSGDM